VLSEKIWEALIKKLFQKDYQFDAGFYGSINEYSKKVAYFFHASLQGTTAQPGAAEALKLVADMGLKQGLLADAQAFTTVQLSRGLKAQDESFNLDQVVLMTLRILSCDVRARKPSDTLFRHAAAALAAQGIKPDEALHVGSKIARDVLPARKMGFRTALYAGDKSSLDASAEALRDPNQRPDVLITELSQVIHLLK